MTMIDAVQSSLSEDALAKTDAAIVSNSLGCSVVSHIEGRPLADLSKLDLASLYAT
jgi:hypothetical protein